MSRRRRPGDLLADWNSIRQTPDNRVDQLVGGQYCDMAVIGGVPGVAYIEDGTHNLKFALFYRGD